MPARSTWSRRPPPLRRQLVVAVVVLVAATVVANVVAHTRTAVALADAVVADEGESSCAGPRWPVKTLADPLARQVDLAHPQGSSVAALRALTVPTVNKNSGRIAGVETRVVRLTAELLSGRLSPDGDLAVVIRPAGSPTDTMIIEFPAQRCLGPQTPAPMRAAALGARQVFEASCGPFSAAKTALAGTGTFTGAVFVDTPHQLKKGVNARQAAPDEVELHPVLAVSALSCQRIAKQGPVNDSGDPAVADQ